jgi:Ankyrin repeat
LQITSEIREDHASYIHEWLTVLKETSGPSSLPLRTPARRLTSFTDCSRGWRLDLAEWPLLRAGASGARFSFFTFKRLALSHNLQKSAVARSRRTWYMLLTPTLENEGALISEGTMKPADKKLFDVMHGGTIRDVTAALDAGADINARDDLNRTPLHWANSVEVATVLLECGADVTAKDKFQNVPIQYAYQEEATELISLLENAYEKQRSQASRIAKRKRQKRGNELGG